jgi:signal transduction histidine kinase
MSHGKVDILLVDDHPNNLVALEAVLEDLGQNLVKAHSGEEALRRVLAADFAVILLDVQMQDLDGFETAKLIRGREKSRQTPIIFLTAYENNRLSTEEAYALGAVDYLVKPLVPLILKAKVAGFIELFQKTEQVKQQAEQLRQLERQAFIQKLAEENARLQESERRLELAQKAARIGTFEWIVPTGELNWTEAEETLYGLPTGGLGAKYENWKKALFPEDRERTEADLFRAVREKTALATEFRVIWPDGSLHWIAAKGKVFYGPKGEPLRMLGVNMDVTEQRLAQEKMKEEARRKDEFLAMLAHELRNPLAPVRNALQIMKMPDADGNDVHQAREIIERQIQHLVRLVDDLLDVSRINRNRIELRKDRVELATVFARAVETAQPAIDAQGHKLNVSLPALPILVEGDLVRLAQVISNLLLNAAKYTDKAGHIWLSGAREQDEAVVRVRDTGVGIDADLLPEIFDLFVQSNRSLARSQGGLGIGLTLVKRLVELHGGSVHANSAAPGQGSEFVVRLPALPENPVHAVAMLESQDIGRAANPRRVLVVDDNVDAAASAAMLLRFLGHEVETAHDGNAALAAAAHFRPEVAFLDIGLPGMSGYDLAKAFRAQPEFARLLLVALTGYGKEEDRRMSQEAGFDRHMIKPVDPAALAGLLADCSGGGREF